MVHSLITYTLYTLSNQQKDPETATAASYLDVLFAVTVGSLSTLLHDTRDFVFRSLVYFSKDEINKRL